MTKMPEYSLSTGSLSNLEVFLWAKIDVYIVHPKQEWQELWNQWTLCIVSSLFEYCEDSGPTSCSNGSLPPLPLKKKVLIFNHGHHDSPETVVLSLEDSRLLSLLLQNQEALRDTENMRAQAQSHLQTGQLLQDHSHGTDKATLKRWCRGETCNPPVLCAFSFS